MMDPQEAPLPGQPRKSRNISDINPNADPLHCAKSNCGRSLMVGEKRKRLKYGFNTTHEGKTYRLCLKCSRKERTKP